MVVFGGSGKGDVACARHLQYTHSALSTVHALHCIPTHTYILPTYMCIFASHCCVLQSQIVQMFEEVFPPNEFPPPHVLSPGAIHVTSVAVSVSVPSDLALFRFGRQL